MSSGEQSKFWIDNLPPYILGGISEAVIAARRDGRDIIDLSQANPDAAPPMDALDKLIQSILLPHNHRYSASRGIVALRQAITGWYERRFGIELDPEREAVVTMGTKEGLTHLLLAMIFPGDNIIVPTPGYPIHASAAFLAGAGFIGVSLFSSQEEGQGEGFELTERSEQFFSRLEATFEHTWPRPKVMVISFPHNPTTTTVTKGFFERLVEFVASRDMLIVHDFAYGSIGFDGYMPPSILEVQGAREVAVELFSLSKCFGVPGWRMSFCVGNERMIAALRRIKSYIDSGIFQPLQIAGIQLLNRADEIIPEIAGKYQRRRDMLLRGLHDIGWGQASAPTPEKITIPRATLFVWRKLPVGPWGESSVEFSNRCLREGHVALCPGIGFGAEGEGYVRFALVESEERISAAVRNLRGIVG